jgi:hypothetical protein
MEIDYLLSSHVFKKVDFSYPVKNPEENLEEKSELLINILKTQSWKENPRLYNLTSMLFKQVVRGKYDDLTKTALKPSVIKIKELFEQFQEKPMPDAYMVEKHDKEHHNGSQLKKYVVGESIVISESDLEKIPQVKYGERDFRFDTWVLFGEDGRVIDRGFSESENDEIERIFVMDRFGQFYMHEDIPGGNGEKAIKHSSFFSGRPVSGSGKFVFNKDGQLIKITNSSGHYRFGEDEMLQTLLALKRHGVDLTNVRVVLHVHKQKIQSIASDWFNLTFLASCHINADTNNQVGR